MAMEHDWRSVNVIAEGVASRLAPQVVVAQGLMAGISEHHMKHIGTLSLTPATFMAVLGDLIDSMARAGFTNILVLNGHGGNIAPCNGVWDQFLRRFQINLQFLPYWDVLTVEDAARAFAMALKSESSGVFNIPGADTIALSHAIAKWGSTDVPVPGTLIGPLYRLRRRVRRTQFRWDLNEHRFHLGNILDGHRAERLLGYSPEHPLAWPRPDRSHPTTVG